MNKRMTLSIENADIKFKNFSGKEGQFNPAGSRNFCVFLDIDQGKQLEDDGWNIRWLTPHDENDDPVPYLQVAVRYDNIPPKIVMISKRGKTLLTEDTVQIVDWAEIDTVDLIITGSPWTMYKGKKNEKSGIKAYAKSVYITIIEEDLDLKYANVPDSAEAAIGGCGNCDTCDGNCGCGGHDD